MYALTGYVNDTIIDDTGSWESVISIVMDMVKSTGSIFREYDTLRSMFADMTEKDISMSGSFFSLEIKKITE